MIHALLAIFGCDKSAQIACEIERDGITLGLARDPANPAFFFDQFGSHTASRTGEGMPECIKCVSSRPTSVPFHRNTML